LASPLRALRSRNFRLYYTGQGASLLGMWVQMVAQSWLMYRLTDSAVAVALVVVASQGPGLFIGPFAGAIADRFPKRRILVVSQVATSVPTFVLAALTLADVVVAWHVFALVLLMGVSRAFEMPVRHAFIPSLVQREDLSNAIGLNSIVFNLARLTGPAVGGAVIALAGEGWCFLANGVSYLCVIVALLAIRVEDNSAVRRGDKSLLADVREGLAYVAGQPLLWALLGVLGTASLFGMPYTVLLPSFADRVLSAGPEVYGVLTSAVGIGAMGSAIVLAMRSSPDGLAGWVVLCALLFGAALFGFSRADALSTAIPSLALIGATFMFAQTGVNTLLQLAAPEELRGRVMSLHSTLFLGVLPLGALVAGAAADRFGEASVLAAGGVLVTASALFFGAILLRATRAREG
jgi:MFS family permease